MYLFLFDFERKKQPPLLAGGWSALCTPGMSQIPHWRGAEPRGTVRRKPERKAMSRRTEMAYKAQSRGKLAPFYFAQGALSLPNVHNITKPRVQEIG